MSMIAYLMHGKRNISLQKINEIFYKTGKLQSLPEYTHAFFANSEL
jgi:hypothetical protein